MKNKELIEILRLRIEELEQRLLSVEARPIYHPWPNYPYAPAPQLPNPVPWNQPIYDTHGQVCGVSSQMPPGTMVS